jgi:hypothetical protein
LIINTVFYGYVRQALAQFSDATDSNIEFLESKGLALDQNSDELIFFHP